MLRVLGLGTGDMVEGFCVSLILKPSYGYGVVTFHHIR